MATNKKPTVSYALLADSHSESDQGKIDVFGVFTGVRVWATPAYRNCSLVVGLKDIPEGAFQLSIWLRAQGEKAASVRTLKGEASSAQAAKTIAIDIPLRLSSMGNHEVGVGIGGNIRGGVFWTPFEVRKREWPELPTGDALQEALNSSDVVTSSRAILKCDECGTEHILQKNLDPDAPIESPAEPFPEDGILICSECGEEHHVKDIEGQVTAQLGKSAQAGEE